MNQHPGRAPGIAFVLLGGLVLAACGQGDVRSAQPITRPTVLGADGRTLTTEITAGGCQKGRLAGAETDSEVTLTLELITHQKSGEACPAYVALAPVSFVLRAPLGTRKVVDGVSGMRLAVARQ
ncbi:MULTISPECIES: hypothetical protein [unclassified Streptomyces]|uniref:hypothetical protein n=1 Tax=unclassified Streptomyces TaxID=2593676 RepID=UPI0038144AB3